MKTKNIFNLLALVANWIIYLRNRALDAQAQRKGRR